MKRIHAGSLCLLIVLLAAPTAFAQGDLIEKNNGKFHAGSIEGEKPSTEDFEKSMTVVLSEDFDFVSYNLTLPAGRKSKQKVEASQVKKIHYYPLPRPWGEAVGAMEDGEFADAVRRFEILVKTRGSRFWIKLYGLRNIARIHEANGQWRKVIAANDRLLSLFPKSRLLPDVTIKTGLCHMWLGDLPSARRTFASLERVRGLPEGKKLLARYWLIYLDQQQGEASKNKGILSAALGKYQRLLEKVKGNAKLAEVATLARLGIGDCMVALGRFDEALKFFQKIADSTDNTNVLAGAFNGLGTCWFEKRNFKNALMAFLRVDILYRENARQRAKALYYVGKTFFLLQDSVDDFKARAREYYNKCIHEFGATKWGIKAKKGLNEIR